jgi:hypothetical protein
MRERSAVVGFAAACALAVSEVWTVAWTVGYLQRGGAHLDLRRPLVSPSRRSTIERGKKHRIIFRKATENKTRCKQQKIKKKNTTRIIG